MSTTETGYPVQFAVDYPDRPLNRLTSAFRIFTVIPIAIVLAALGHSYSSGSYDPNGDSWQSSGGATAGLLVLAPALMILFRQKYPRWWFDFNAQLLSFINRVGAYYCLLTDVYPSTDEEQSVHLEVPYPDAKEDLNRWFPLFKWFLAIPHYFILVFLILAAWVCIIIAWFAILFTGRYPKGLFDFVVGVGRWINRVTAYMLILTTDTYPPFSLNP
jgi:hypothetical protein